LVLVLLLLLLLPVALVEAQGSLVQSASSSLHHGRGIGQL
jgi:hypothetical protein